MCFYVYIGDGINKLELSFGFWGILLIEKDIRMGSCLLSKEDINLMFIRVLS